MIIILVKIKKKKPTEVAKEKVEYDLGHPPRIGTDCMPSFVWALQERTGTENVFYDYKDKNKTKLLNKRVEKTFTLIGKHLFSLWN